MAEIGEGVKPATPAAIPPEEKTTKPRDPDLATVLEAGWRGVGSILAEPNGTIHYGRDHDAICKDLTGSRVGWVDWINDGWQRINIYREQKYVDPHPKLIVHITVAGTDNTTLEKRLATGLEVVRRVAGAELDDARVIWEAGQGNFADPDRKFTEGGLGRDFLDRGIRIRGRAT